MVVARGYGEERVRGGCSMEIEFQFRKTKRGLEMDAGDGCTVVSATELYPYKGLRGSALCYVCILPQLTKKKKQS